MQMKINPSYLYSGWKETESVDCFGFLIPPSLSLNVAAFFLSQCTLHTEERPLVFLSLSLSPTLHRMRKADMKEKEKKETTLLFFAAAVANS